MMARELVCNPDGYVLHVFCNIGQIIITEILLK